MNRLIGQVSSYVAIKIQEEVQTTPVVYGTRHPVFEDVLEFKAQHFDATNSTTYRAHVDVLNHNRATQSDTLMGSATFQLPKKFDTVYNQVLKIENKDNEALGVLVIDCVMMLAGHSERKREDI